MKTTELIPAPSGAPRGGIRQTIPVLALGAPEGVFTPMNEEPADPAALREMLAKTRNQLTRALEANAKLYMENKRLTEAAKATK